MLAITRWNFMASKMPNFWPKNSQKTNDNNFPCTYRGVWGGLSPPPPTLSPGPCEHDLGDRGLAADSAPGQSQGHILLPAPFALRSACSKNVPKHKNLRGKHRPFVPGRQNLQMLPPNGPPLPPPRRKLRDRCRGTCLEEHPSQVTIGPTI